MVLPFGTGKPLPKTTENPSTHKTDEVLLKTSESC